MPRLVSAGVLAGAAGLFAIALLGQEIPVVGQAASFSGDATPGSTLAEVEAGLAKIEADVTRLLAVELAPDIRVNGVAPGAIMPPADAPEGYLEGLAAGLPLRRTGGPPDIVGAVRFLLQSPFVTGQVIFVDGGQHLLGSSHD